MAFPHVRATDRLIPTEFTHSCQVKLEENELLMLTISLEHSSDGQNVKTNQLLGEKLCFKRTFYNVYHVRL
jgi:hypothetical protein